MGLSQLDSAASRKWLSQSLHLRGIGKENGPLKSRPFHSQVNRGWKNA